MEYFLTNLADGLSRGCIYALIALGFSMVYGVLKQLNFAHSEVFTSGVYGAYWSQQLTTGYLHWDPFVSVLVSLITAPLVAGAVALLIERVAYRPLRNEPKISVLLTGIGMSIFLQTVGILLFTARTRGFPPLPIPVPPRVFSIVILALTFSVILFIVYRTPWGLRIRAVAEDRERAELTGIHAGRVIQSVFLLGGVFAGIAGVVWGQVYGIVHPQMGFYPGIKAFIISVVGSVGNLTGTFLIGLSTGYLESVAAGYLPSEFSAYTDSLVFAILILALVLRPGGVFSQETVKRV